MAKLLSMPVSASLYPEPPYYYTNAEMVSILFSVDRDKVASIVPEPLKLPRSPIIMAFVAWYPETTIGPYHEAATLIQSFLKTESTRVEGFYCNSMFVDSDVALAAGREIWGYPKKLADMSVKKAGNKFVGLLRRNGIDVMKITIEPQNALQSLPNAETLTLKQIIKPDGSGLELREFIKTPMQMEAIDAKAGTATIEFQESDADPLYLLEPKTLMQGLCGKINLVLPYGTIIWQAPQ
ncbi:MAG TPA: acetoacetate decarboxylase family protein [Candidatus Deferrimicrobium sp.]|nr:acetoacetate decarboxylase family protein [Candidatus Deferrimicrobium sp.]